MPMIIDQQNYFDSTCIIVIWMISNIMELKGYDKRCCVGDSL